MENYMEEIMNKENDWDQVTKANAVERPIKKVTWVQMVVAMKPG